MDSLHQWLERQQLSWLALAKSSGVCDGRILPLTKTPSFCHGTASHPNFISRRMFTDIVQIDRSSALRDKVLGFCINDTRTSQICRADGRSRCFLPNHCPLCTRPPCRKLAKRCQSSVGRRDFRRCNLRFDAYFSVWLNRLRRRSLCRHNETFFSIDGSAWLVVSAEMVSDSQMQGMEEFTYLYNSLARTLSDTPSKCDMASAAWAIKPSSDLPERMSISLK